MGCSSSKAARRTRDPEDELTAPRPGACATAAAAAAPALTCKSSPTMRAEGGGKGTTRARRLSLAVESKVVRGSAGGLASNTLSSKGQRRVTKCGVRIHGQHNLTPCTSAWRPAGACPSTAGVPSTCAGSRHACQQRQGGQQEPGQQPRQRGHSSSRGLTSGVAPSPQQAAVTHLHWRGECWLPHDALQPQL